MSMYAKNLRMLRKKSGLTQEQLAEKAGTSKQVISRYELGMREPNITMAMSIARALGTPIERFVEEAG